MADEKTMLDKLSDRLNAVLEKPWNAMASVVNFVMQDGSLQALGREGLKDVQDTFHQAAFGQTDHSREPGAPLSPLHQDIAEARESYAPTKPTSTPSQIVNERKVAGTVHGPEQQAEKAVPSPSQIVNEGKAAVAEQGLEQQAEKANTLSPSEIVNDRGQRKALGPWTQQVLERSQEKDNGGTSGNDQNERAENRSLADEQREQREQERGRGR